MSCALAAEHFWIDRSKYGDAECKYYEQLSKAICNEQNHKESALIDSSRPNLATPKGDVSNIRNLVESCATLKDLNTDELGNTQFCTPNKTVADPKLTKRRKKKNASKNAKEMIKKNEESLNSNDPSLKLSKSPPKKATNIKSKGATKNGQCTLVSEIAKAREHIKNSLEKMDGIANLSSSPQSAEFLERLIGVEKENLELRKLVESLQKLCLDTQKRVAALESRSPDGTQNLTASSVENKTTQNDDDVDLFASESDEEESAEAARIREERLASYAAKKSKKPALIAKSSLVLDVKPWDDETDLKVMESEIRKITSDGLLWGASKFVPVAFGIQKLSISCVVEDEKISIDWLTEEIEKLEDFVQSVDVAAFNKI